MYVESWRSPNYDFATSIFTVRSHWLKFRLPPNARTFTPRSMKSSSLRERSPRGATQPAAPSQSSEPNSANLDWFVLEPLTGNEVDDDPETLAIFCNSLDFMTTPPSGLPLAELLNLRRRQALMIHSRLGTGEHFWRRLERMSAVL